MRTVSRGVIVAMALYERSHLRVDISLLGKGCCMDIKHLTAIALARGEVYGTHPDLKNGKLML